MANMLTDGGEVTGSVVLYCECAYYNNVIDGKPAGGVSGICVGQPVTVTIADVKAA
jgi:hypothetical protein